MVILGALFFLALKFNLLFFCFLFFSFCKRGFKNDKIHIIKLHSLLNAKIKNRYNLDGNSRAICYIYRDKEVKKILESCE